MMAESKVIKSNSKLKNKTDDKKEQKVIVGQFAFNQYLKIQADELIACGKNVKKDNEFKKLVASKWHTLTPTEKAKYSIPGPDVSSGITKKSRNTSKSSATISTRCSPHQFQQVVSKFSGEQIAAITELGFGTLVQLSCTRVRRDLCRFLIDKFDTEECLIELHGKSMKVSSLDFKQIMSVPEGGTDVDFSGSIEDPDMKPLVDYYVGNSGYIEISDIIAKLDGANVVDDHFGVSFILLALGTLLCPNTSTHLNPKYLLALKNLKNIRSMNWESFSFEFLLESVRLFKQNKAKYISGCVLFFQLYYYNVIEYGRALVDCEKPSIAAWGEEQSAKLIKWILQKGGHESPNILVSKVYNSSEQKHEAENVVALRADVESVKSTIMRVEEKIDELGGLLRGIQEGLFKVVRQNGDQDVNIKRDEANDTIRQNHQESDDFKTQSSKEVEVNDESSCQIQSEDNSEAAHPKIKEEFIIGKTIRTDTKSTKFSPINTRRTAERKPSQAISYPFVKLGFNLDDEQIDEYLHGRTLNLKRIGEFKGPFDFDQ